MTDGPLIAESLRKGEFHYIVAGRPRRVGVLAVAARMQALVPDWAEQFATTLNAAEDGEPLSRDDQIRSLRELLEIVRAARAVLDLPAPDDHGGGVTDYEVVTLLGSFFRAAEWIIARKAG